MSLTSARRCAFTLGGLFLLFTLGSADDSAIKMKIGGCAGLEFGQIVQGSYAYNNPVETQPIVKGWQERFLFHFINDVAATERIRMIMDIEGQIAFSYPQMLNPPESEAPRYLFNPIHIEGMYTLGDAEKPLFQFGVGYFPYKFNPDARNLGEVLFRSGTYPLYVLTNFDHCYGELLGFRASSTLLDGSLKMDLLFTSEALMFPTQDYGLSAVVHYDCAHWLDVGAGISVAHLFSTEGKLTNGTSFQDGLYVPNPDDTAHSYYGFQGVKPALTLAIDPKPFLPSSMAGLLGQNDGRLYGELCVSGWENRKNYDTTKSPFWDYSDRLQRTVALIGYNIPTFKLLDVLALEFEYFPNKYANSYRQVFDENIAIPYIQDSRERAPWKWSLYAKRTILDNFFIVCQMARDHMRPTLPDIKNSEREDVLNKVGDWWWVASLNFTM